MLSVGIPEMAVRQKMVKDGVDPLTLFKAEPLSNVTTTRIQRVASVNKAKSASSSASSAPRPPTITVMALEEIRAGLRKPGRQSQSSNDKENATPKQQPFAVTLAAIQEIRSNLRRTTKTPDSGSNRQAGVRSGLRDISNQSASKTPHTQKKLKSPSTARSDGEYLHLALLRKFQNVDSPSQM